MGSWIGDRWRPEGHGKGGIVDSMVEKFPDIRSTDCAMVDSAVNSTMLDENGRYDEALDGLHDLVFFSTVRGV